MAVPYGVIAVLHTAALSLSLTRNPTQILRSSNPHKQDILPVDRVNISIPGACYRPPTAVDKTR